MFLRHTWVTLSLSLAAACSSYSSPHVVIGDQRFFVEIADQADERTVGLMFRDEMASDHGMLFIFPDSELRSFWMKNCRISLDILYFDSERRLINLHHGAPPCRSDPCPGYPSDAPARYVLELNGGIAARLDLQRGDRLEMNL